MKAIFLLIFVLFIQHHSIAQSCCSGGVPISGNLGLPISDEYKFQLNLAYDLNILNTLKTGSETLEDNTRKRTTHTLIVQSGYTINKYLSVEVLLPFVRQERMLSPIGLPSSFDATQGLGDLVLLQKVRFANRYQFGIGLKFPTGSSTELNSRGIILSADMQPGSGSWDIIYWASARHNFDFRPTLTFNILSTYKSTGENKSYFGNQVYEFGNEILIQLSVSDQLVILNQIIGPSLAIKYRRVGADINDSFEVPSTGGTWVFLQPGLSYSHSPKLAFLAVYDLPIYAKLTGTQISPTHRLNLSILLNF